MKKVIAFVTSLMIVMALSACGPTTSETANNDSDKTSDESMVANSSDEEEEAEDETADEENNDEKVSESKKKKTDNTSVKSGFKESTIEETVLIDQDGIKVTATDLSFSKYSAKLSLELENNSDKNVKLMAGTWGYSCNSINGIMIEDGGFNCSVTSGKKAKETITFSCDELNMLGIYEIADIELGIYSTDDDDNYTYYPIIPIKTSISDEFDYNKLCPSEAIKTNSEVDVLYSSDEVIYNVDDVEINSELLIKSDNSKPVLLLEVKNESDYSTEACISNISINGIKVSDSLWSGTTINAHKTAVLDIELGSVFEEEYWDAYNMNELKNIQFSFYLEDRESDHETDPVEIVIPISSDKIEPDTTGDVIYEKQGLRIIFKGLGMGKYGLGKSVMLLIENKSGKNMYVNADGDSVSVNGNMMSSFIWYKNVDDNENKAWTFDLSDSDLKDIDISQISDINEIEFGVKVVEEDDWSSKWDENYDTVTIKPSH